MTNAEDIERGIKRLRAIRYVGPATAIDRLAHDAWTVADEAVAVLESVLDDDTMDYDKCNALDGFDLCGSRWCEACGCITDKLARARALLASVDTHPKDGDALAAPLVSGAVPNEDSADAQQDKSP